MKKKIKTFIFFKYYVSYRHLRFTFVIKVDKSFLNKFKQANIAGVTEL